MIPKSGRRLSEKIMLLTKVMERNFIRSDYALGVITRLLPQRAS
jgi:hypothetical protein